MDGQTKEFVNMDDLVPLRFRAGEKQVFCDWSLVEPGYGMPFWHEYQIKIDCEPWLSPRGVALRTYKPTLLGVAAGDEPLGQAGGYASLCMDGGKLRLWHDCYAPTNARGDLGAVLCLKESTDGENWIPYQGEYKNAVYGYGEHGGDVGAHGAGVLFDPQDEPNARYKLAHLGASPAGSRLPAWVFGATSPDGVTWTRLAEPLVATPSDTQMILSRTCEGFELYLRGWSPESYWGGGGRRVVRMTSSKTFGGFGDPVDVLRPPARFLPHQDIYTSAHAPWPGARGLSLMLPAIYDRAKDTTEVRFAVKRDGGVWDFPSDLPLVGGDGDPAVQTVYAGSGLVPFGEGKWLFPVHVSEKAHNEYVRKNRHIRLASIREDGFIGIEADLEGSFVTFPLALEGESISVNGWARPGGEIRAEVLRVQSDGRPVAVEGFALEDCVPLKGDVLWQKLDWGGKSLETLRDKPFRLRFRLLRARIHSLMIA